MIVDQKETQARRVASFSNHLIITQHHGPASDGAQLQQCAATHQSLFAKAAASGAKFARPAQQQFSRDERVYETAMLYASGLKDPASAPPPQQRALALYRTTPVPKQSTLPTGKGSEFEAVSGWTPQVHTISRNGGDIYIFLLPGVKAADLKLQLAGSKLTISGKRVRGLKVSQGGMQGREVPVKRASDPWFALPALREQSKAVSIPSLAEELNFTVTWVFPPGGDLAAMRAQFDGGRLRVVLPKPNKSFAA